MKRCPDEVGTLSETNLPLPAQFSSEIWEGEGTPRPKGQGSLFLPKKDKIDED